MIKKNTKVYIDPACNILYSSFYIVGLRDLYGDKNIIFDSKPFKELHYHNENFLLAFVIDGIKYIIDSTDFNTINYPEFVEWADLYGKVNYNIDNIPPMYRNKIIPIGANFGIACYGNNREINIIWAIKHYLQCHTRLEYNWKSYLCRYLTVYKRKSQPHNFSSSDNYIFFISRFWEGQNTANNIRINFIRACKRLHKEQIIRFEGGMIPDNEISSCPKDVIIKKEIPLKEYIIGIQKSALVFNTPAYHGCHGWKLPEYMSQGVAILSTHFNNELPIPLQHKINVYFSNPDEDSLYNSIKVLIQNKELRQRLQKNITQYWQSYACPTSCLKLFLTKINKSH